MNPMRGFIGRSCRIPRASPKDVVCHIVALHSHPQDIVRVLVECSGMVALMALDEQRRIVNDTRWTEEQLKGLSPAEGTRFCMNTAPSRVDLVSWLFHGQPPSNKVMWRLISRQAKDKGVG